MTNGCFYVVSNFDAISVTIRDLESDQVVVVPVEHMRTLRLGWSCTLASIQGRTLRKRTRIWDTDHRNFTTRHLAMAIGRVTRPEDLDIA